MFRKAQPTPPTSRDAGSRGETLAREYLEKKGYRFLTQNWRCKLGEIDLLMQDGDDRVLVEVRLRAPTTYGAGFETVSYQKQKKLIRAAKFYQQKESYWGNLRFDVVSITEQRGQPPHIEHITAAF
ncbi:MAG: YraN family protein [Candidatus Andersenbacteria bacterium]